MTEQETLVEIPLSRYKALLRKEIWVLCLEEAGLDEWEGRDFAVSLYENQVIK